jgi:dihydroorotase
VPQQLQEIWLDGSVDPHFHARNDYDQGDGRMEVILTAACQEHEAIVCIGNSSPIILTQQGADEYLNLAQKHVAAGSKVDLYVAPLLTDATTPAMIYEMRRDPRIPFIKGFLAHVSNDGGHSVSNIRALRPTLLACHDESTDAPPLPVHWHMERKFDRKKGVIAMRNREWYAIRNDLAVVLEVDPKGSHTVKHVSDARTLARLREYRRKGYCVYGEIASHYFVRNHEDLYEGPDGKGTAFRAHDLCWPIYKSRDSQLKLIEAALSETDIEEGLWFFGSDCACHKDDPTCASGAKITNDGVVCGGTAILPALSKSIVIDLFVKRGKEHLLNAFLSGNARRALGLPPARTKVCYVREERIVPDVLPADKPFWPTQMRPFMKGEKYYWHRKD